MSNVSRGSTTDKNRPLADSPRWPVLARLPNVSANAMARGSTKQPKLGAIEYRFDPPQLQASADQSAIPTQPHVFERRHPADRQSRLLRRESPILPRSNPFSIPSTSLIDSLAPAVRFLTMVGLFTAAGIWFQMMGRHAQPAAQPVESPQTAQQPAIAPAKNAVDHTIPATSAVGPIQTPPQSGARVGRAHDGDGFASYGPPTAPTHVADHPAIRPPHFLVAGSRLPRVQTSDACPIADGVGGAVEDEPAGPDEFTRRDNNSADNKKPDDTSVARVPGFLIEIPSR